MGPAVPTDRDNVCGALSSDTLDVTTLVNKISLLSPKSELNEYWPLGVIGQPKTLLKVDPWIRISDSTGNQPTDMFIN